MVRREAPSISSGACPLDPHPRVEGRLEGVKNAFDENELHEFIDEGCACVEVYVEKLGKRDVKITRMTWMVPLRTWCILEPEASWKGDELTGD